MSSNCFTFAITKLTDSLHRKLVDKNNWCQSSSEKVSVSWPFKNVHTFYRTKRINHARYEVSLECRLRLLSSENCRRVGWWVHTYVWDKPVASTFPLLRCSRGHQAFLKRQKSCMKLPSVNIWVTEDGDNFIKLFAGVFVERFVTFEFFVMRDC
jgi:hypothetical protein